MSMPKRIQRHRILGWRKPDGAVYVGRGSKWGNPFRARRPFEITGWLSSVGGEASLKGDVRDHEHAVRLYRAYLTDGITPPALGLTFISPIADQVHELRGKDLMCWCRLDAPCHADVLLELANAGAAA